MLFLATFDRRLRFRHGTKMNDSKLENSTPNDSYMVVARRYRPTTFEQLIGQDQVGLALRNAIEQNRVGHAYLFTGARGVGKTSTARIFAKCLNCKTGPTIKPCNSCDQCLSIAAGEDVDVLEIDGASNRGIDNIRDLRSNANIRPSRSHFKVYIIDEVHMLSREAFNALLKTLEEPPSHVKFIFCTTDPEKIPITVLSRCQRYDFVPVRTDEIKNRLQEIVDNENVEADPAALNLLAQRAKGSMRDSQSLLEQILSFADGKITVQQVNELLGTADTGQIFELINNMLAGESGDALRTVDLALNHGVDAGQLTEQLLGLFRDVMAAKSGCDAEIFLQASNDDAAKVKSIAGELDFERLLSSMQVLDQALVSMSRSAHSRTLLEMALVRICNLGNLKPLSAIIDFLQSGNSGTVHFTAESSTPDSSRESASVQSDASPDSKKNEVANEVNACVQPIPVSDKASAGLDSNGKVHDSVSEEPFHPEQRAATVTRVDGGVKSDGQHPVAEKTRRPNPVDNSNVEAFWKKTLEGMSGITADMASDYRSLAVQGENQLVVTLDDNYKREACDRPEKKASLEQEFESVTGHKFRIDFVVDPNSEQASSAAKPVQSRRKVMRDLQKDPVIQRAIEIFDAEITDFQRIKRG